MGGSGPTYDLAQVAALVATKRHRITGLEVKEASELGFDESDIVECVGALSSAHFCKTMEAEKRPGFWQDVYRTEHGGIPLYMKIQLEGTNPNDLLVVIQFKRL